MNSSAVWETQDRHADKHTVGLGICWQCLQPLSSLFFEDTPTWPCIKVCLVFQPLLFFDSNRFSGSVTKASLYLASPMMFTGLKVRRWCTAVVLFVRKDVCMLERTCTIDFDMSKAPCGFATVKPSPGPLGGGSCLCFSKTQQQCHRQVGNVGFRHRRLHPLTVFDVSMTILARRVYLCLMLVYFQVSEG